LVQVDGTLATAQSEAFLPGERCELSIWRLSHSSKAVFFYCIAQTLRTLRPIMFEHW
jgi:hypothetical protein